MVDSQSVIDPNAVAELLTWFFRVAIMLLIGVITWFLRRTANVLDETSKTLHDHERRLSLVELLVEQHEKELDRAGLEKLVRRRYREEIKKQLDDEL